MAENKRRKEMREEIISTVQVSEDIDCKDCAYADDGTIYSNHYTKGSCQQYPYPDTKPLSVLFDDVACPKYKKKD
jgi:hypothetical protein